MQEPRRQRAVHDAHTGREIAQPGSPAEAEYRRPYAGDGIKSEFVEQMRYVLSDTGSSA
jgi:hypothetical protein